MEPMQSQSPMHSRQPFEHPLKMIDTPLRAARVAWVPQVVGARVVLLVAAAAPRAACKLAPRPVCVPTSQGNIRGLLASLQTVMWEGSGWKPIGMGDLLEPNQVRGACMLWRWCSLDLTCSDSVRLASRRRVKQACV